MKKRILLIVMIAKLVVTNAQTFVGENLDINNIKASINSDGTLFWNNTSSTFEVPKGSGKQTIGASGLWIGGMDTGWHLRMAGQTYRQNGADFFFGPIDSTGTYGASYDSVWNRVWKINKCAIDTYQNWLLNSPVGINPLLSGVSEDTNAMEAISHWPAFDMYGRPLAPFEDVNLDGVYDPTVGDVPKIKGDQAIFFVYNDARAAHTESGGVSLGIEIQGMAYAFNCPDDTALYNTIFTNYKIVNRSESAISTVKIGNWTDFDIGFYGDDYIGCDVARGAYYGYNGTAIDGTGQSTAYGNIPPAEAVVFLQGPWANANGYDETPGMFVNETNCGDGIIDNERLGMSKFMSFNNNSSSINGNPLTANHWYNYLSGTWKNGMGWTYGEDGTNADSVLCDFMFPDSSDPIGYGVGGTVNTPASMPAWNELSSNNIPGDRRGVGSYGPFTLAASGAGSIEEIDFAYVYGRATFGDNMSSVAVMKNRIDSVRQKFDSGFSNAHTGCGCTNITAGVKESAVTPTFVVYPNPTTDNIKMDYQPATKNASVKIFGSTGNLIKEIALEAQSTQSISTKDLASGLYIIKLQDGGKSSFKKFIKE